MKKLSLLMPLFAVVFFLAVNKGYAQQPPPPVPGLSATPVTTIPATEDYFMGKWKATIKGIPQGDTDVALTVEKKDGKLAGSMFNSKDNTTVPFDTIEIKDGLLAVTFTAQGYSINMSLGKKDDDNIAGSVMNQFDVTGARVK